MPYHETPDHTGKAPKHQRAALKPKHKNFSTNPTIKMQELTHPTLPSGWKVHINGEKFPKEHGFWYTLSKNESRENALQSWRELHENL